MAKYGKGWERLVEDLKTRAEQAVPGIEIKDIQEGQFGKLLFTYSLSGLSDDQRYLMDSIAARAEKVAWQTCRVCGRLGKPAWITPPPLARVFCDKHKPDDWNFI